MGKIFQVVLDTNVWICALRSQYGGSHKLLSLLDKGKFEINISVPLILEYEDVAKRLSWKGKVSEKAIDDILDYICLIGNRRKIHFLWRPRCHDPKDDMILEVAVAGQCDCIITYNKKDLADAKDFDMALLTPREFLALIGEHK